MNLPSKITSLLAVFLLVPAMAIAQEHGDMEDKASKQMERMADKLELTDSQRQQWQALHEQYHPRMQEIYEEMREHRENLRESSLNGFDEGLAQVAAERLGELTREASLLGARMHAQVGEILTDEQREQFSEHYKTRDKHGKKHGKDKDKDKNKDKDKDRNDEDDD